MKKQKLTKHLNSFQDASLDTPQQNATKGGFFRFTMNSRGIPTKMMAGNVVLFDTNGNGNGVW